MTSFDPNTPRRVSYAYQAAANEAHDRRIARYIQKRLALRAVARRNNQPGDPK